MAKKRLDVAAITNELQHSAFFPAAAPAAPGASTPAPPGSDPISAPRTTSTSSRSPVVQQPDQRLPAERTPVVGAPAAVGARVDAPATERPTDTAETPEDATKGSQIASKRASDDASTNASLLAHYREGNQGGAQETPPERDLTPSPDHSHEGGDERGVIEAIRRCVKQVGKEVSFVRLTPDEKRQLADIAYTYKSQGIKTSENEISRVGINWMLDDYHANGANSVLAKVLAALNA